MIIFKRKLQGISLIEIVIALVMSVIVVLWGAQGMTTYFQQRKQYVFMQQLYHDLKWARLEAIVLQDLVTVQAHQDWCHGWDIVRSTHQVLKIRTGLQDCQIIFSSFPQLAYFQFSPEGASYYQNATFTFYVKQQASMQIVINQAGRVRW